MQLRAAQVKSYTPRSTTQSMAWLRMSFLRADAVRNLREIAARREAWLATSAILRRKRREVQREAGLATCCFCGADGLEFCNFKI